MMAALLVFPPLTSVVADGLGIELAHHHCDSHGHDAVPDGTVDPDADQHNTAEIDPFQCDQCHLVLAALGPEWVFSGRALVPVPDPVSVRVLSPVRTSPEFRPPIA